MYPLKRQDGFTFVELVMAMALFSFVLLVLTTGVIKLFNIYQAGVGIRNTQQVARLISDDIVRNGRKAVTYQLYQPVSPSNLVNVTVAGGLAVAQPHDAICFYSTFGGLPAVSEGTIYYSELATGPGVGPNEFNIFRSRITNPVCSPANKTGATQRLNSKSVSVLKFDAQPGPAAPVNLANRVVRFDIVLGAMTAIQPEDLVKRTGVNEVDCRGQAGIQFCSTTNVSGGVGLRNLN